MSEKEKIFGLLHDLRYHHKIDRKEIGLKPCIGCMDTMDQIVQSVEKLQEGEQ